MRTFSRPNNGVFQANERKDIFKLVLYGSILTLSTGVLSRPSFAVVGQAERFDEFREQDLLEFQESLTGEEKAAQMNKAVDVAKMIEQKQAEANAAEGETRQAVTKDIESLKKELLSLPKRDRFRFGLDGQYLFDTNIPRFRPHYEKSDSVFDTAPFAEFDLSGKKTDLRFEVRGAKQWNIHFPEKDFWSAEERIRYRRKYFKKVIHSLNSRLARTSEKTVEIDEKKVRWDSFQNTAFNFSLFRKLSLNTEFNWNKRLFTNEASDQDSYWEVIAAPSAFWNFTPKSRVALGYSLGTNRIRSKTSNANSHQIHIGYFGKVTKKSSMSSDISYSHQTPKSLQAAKVNTLTVGKGFIYQATPKTQLTLQLLRSQQNSTSNVISGTENETTQADTHFTNNSITFSLNTRLTRRVTTILTTNASILHTTVKAGGDKDSETTQFLFPTTLSLDYLVKRWLRLRFAYTFVYRVGYEKADEFRSHQWVVGFNSVF